MGRDRELPPPLEMACLNALWEIGEGNVEDVRRVIAQDRQLAYTTVLTLLDRLARRGAVSRRREGRGFRYQPTAERDKVRVMALRMFLDHHFSGSLAKLRAFLETQGETLPDLEVLQVETVAPKAMAASAGSPFPSQE